MTFHAVRQNPASGSARTNAEGHDCSPRISVSLDEKDFRRASWLAAQRKVPLAAVIRDAVYAYCLCIAPEADEASK